MSVDNGLYLVVHEDVHDVLVHLASDAVLGPPGEDDELNSKQRHQDEGGSHRLHVHVGFGTVCVPQLGHQHPDDVQEEEEVHLQPEIKSRAKNERSCRSCRSSRSGVWRIFGIFSSTHKKSRHDGAVHGVEEMCFHAHPAATEGGGSDISERHRPS